MSGIIKQLEGRQFSTEVTAMLWSPKMDLLATSNVKGEVILHRLTWQRVWLLSPQEESDTTAQLAWRPDGKLLAVCYENSKLLCIVDIETKDVIHKTKLSRGNLIVYVNWLLHENHSSMSDELTGDYLQCLPKLNTSDNTATKYKKFLSNTLDIFYIGEENGTVSMYIFGMFYCGTITVGNGPILQITGGSDESIWITSKNDDCIKTGRVSCPLIEKSNALLKIAQFQINIECLKNYLSCTITIISKSWDSILFKLNEKLTRYAEANPGRMSADFLDLLMIGKSSTNLENFLIHDITEAELKEILKNFDICHNEMKKLITENLISVGNALVYQLAELRGLLRVGGTYEAIGLRDETFITNAINECGTFLAKSYEFQQVIHENKDNYEGFIWWLYIHSFRLKNLPIPSKIRNLNQQELTFIVELLNGFDKAEPRTDGKIMYADKLGQYLNDKNLHTPLTSASEWAVMLESNDCLRDDMHIIKPNFNLSLLQSSTNLVAAIENIFNKTYQGLYFVNIPTSFEQSQSLASLISSQIVTNSGSLLLAMSNIESNTLKLYNIKQTDFNRQTSSTEPILNSKETTIDINYKQKELSSEITHNMIVDLQFYSQDYIILLLLNKQTDAFYLVQVPLQDRFTFENRKDETIFLADIFDSVWSKAYEGISMKWLAISGPRKVGAVLSENKKNIRLFEIEAEPGDDEDDYAEEIGDFEKILDYKIKLN